VQITVSTRGNRITLVVEDNGPGIAPAERASLFDRFHRATNEGVGAGLGLGDAVVRATGGEWRVGVASLGGVRMEIRGHRSSSGKESVERMVAVPMATNSDPDKDGSLIG
jgi:C4-dicarboxylate-specific signal transduction histidine kinase